MVSGGKKSSFYHDDIWTIKYLPKFKWHHLTERVADEKAVREQKLRAELSQAKRENNIFLKNVEKSKMVKDMEERKRKKQLGLQGDEGVADRKEQMKRKNDEFQQIRSRFKQRRAIENEDRDLPASVVSKLLAQRTR